MAASARHPLGAAGTRACGLLLAACAVLAGQAHAADEYGEMLGYSGADAHRRARIGRGQWGHRREPRPRAT